MTLLNISLFFAASAAGGAINSVAGGGTFVVFPVLMMNGLQAVEANIMSTIALWPGSLASVVAYRRQIDVEKKRLLPLILVSVLGSALGTAILLSMSEAAFAHMVPWLLLGATLLFTLGPLLTRRSGESGNLKIRAFAGMTTGKAALPIQFLIAVYGGYFGAGIGILMLAMLQLLGGRSIHKMNALKTILGSAINAVAVAVFIASGRVIWPLALVMIAGSAAGGYWGAHAAQKIAPAKVRFLVSAIGFAMTAYFFLHKS